MKKALLISVLLAMLALMYSDCTKDGEPTAAVPDTGLTSEEKSIIRSSDSLISTSANAILLGSNPVQGWQQMLSTYKAYPYVDDAWVTNVALFVKYKKSVTVCWIKDLGFPAPISSPQSKPCMPESQHQVIAMNKKVCLINCLDRNDLVEGWTWDVIDRLAAKFRQEQYEVTVVPRTDATLSFFGTRLSEFSIILYIGHGNYNDKEFVATLQTGERVPDNWLDLNIDDGVMLFTLPNLLAGRVWGFNERYIANKYSNKTFPNSMIFLGGCQALKGSAGFAQVFSSRGCAVTLGYDEDNKVSPSAAEQLITKMLNGLDLQAAYDQLPSNYKVDPSCGHFITSCVANLLHLPVNGGLPSTPTLLSPEIAAADQPLTPTLDWTDANNATAYLVQVSTSPSFTRNIIDDSSPTSSEFVVPAGRLNGNTQYYWRVRAKNFIGSSSWAAGGTPWYFTTTASAPTTILYDDFEGYSTNTFPSSGGWVLLHNGAGNSYQVVTNAQHHSGNKCMQLRGSRSAWWAAHMYKSIQFTQSPIFTEVWLMASASPTGDSEDMGRFLFNGSQEWPGYIFMLLMGLSTAASEVLINLWDSLLQVNGIRLECDSIIQIKK